MGISLLCLLRKNKSVHLACNLEEINEPHSQREAVLVVINQYKLSSDTESYCK